MANLEQTAVVLVPAQDSDEDFAFFVTEAATRNYFGYKGRGSRPWRFIANVRRLSRYVASNLVVAIQGIWMLSAHTKNCSSSSSKQRPLAR